MTFRVIFVTRASIVCISSGTCDTILVSLAFTIRFFDISINRYTPNVRISAVGRYFTTTTPEKCEELTHWGRVPHICVSNLTTIGSVNGLSPGRRQAITWTNAEILLIGPLGTNFSEILIEIYTFSFKKMHLKMSSAKWRPFCLGLNELTHWSVIDKVMILKL